MQIKLKKIKIQKLIKEIKLDFAENFSNSTKD